MCLSPVGGRCWGDVNVSFEGYLHKKWHKFPNSWEFLKKNMLHIKGKFVTLTKVLRFTSLKIRFFDFFKFIMEKSKRLKQKYTKLITQLQQLSTHRCHFISFFFCFHMPIESLSHLKIN
jgi:hypothetical protein